MICAPVYSNYHGLKTQVLVDRDGSQAVARVVNLVRRRVALATYDSLAFSAWLPVTVVLNGSGLDLQQFVELGLVRRHGQGRATTYEVIRP